LPTDVDFPLLRLLKASLVLDHIDSSEISLHGITKAGAPLPSLRRLLRPTFPRGACLTQILSETQRYWALWPISPNGPLTYQSGEIIGLVEAKDYLTDSLNSESAPVLAKAVLWLALCVQQLPKVFRVESISGQRIPPTDVVNHYAEISERLLHVMTESQTDDIVGVEALILLSKLYLNMGRPRASWLRNRQALDRAIFLGLHTPGKEGQGKKLWAILWQNDRFMSVILGFPYSVPRGHPSTSEELQGDSLEAKIIGKISAVAASISDEQQSILKSYATVLRLDEELQECRRLIPTDWWGMDQQGVLGLGQFFGRQALKLAVHYMSQFLHLPYMLMASDQTRYEHSRLSALEAARGISKCYRGIRRSDGGNLIICDVMDFKAFSAGMVMAIDLLNQARQRRERPADDDSWSRDWVCVKSLVADLVETAEALDCSVASQGAQTLQFLYDVCHGTYNGPESYVASIPYLGRVRIRRPSVPIPGSQQELQSDLALPQQPLGEVEITSNFFDLYLPHTSQVGDELAVNWASPPALDESFDWTGYFSFP